MVVGGLHKNLGQLNNYKKGVPICVVHQLPRPSGRLSCNCLSMRGLRQTEAHMSKPIDMIGKHCRSWTVLKRAENNKHGGAMWLSRCKCGAEKIICGTVLRNGHSASCGCESRSKLIDLTGKCFNRWTVLGRARNDSHGKAMWLCQCDCGVKRAIYSFPLRHNKSKSCKRCARHESIIGMQFSRLEVLEYIGIRGHHSFWLCRCDCGNEAKVKGVCLKRGSTRSCGCLHKEMLSKQTGEKNPSWNPNLTDEERKRKRQYSEYRIWRKLVYGRDDYTCQACDDSRGGNLIAHHLYSFTSYPEHRTDVSNGITLCEKCHKEFHKMYGRGNNTPEQFYEWRKESE